MNGQAERQPGKIITVMMAGDGFIEQWVAYYAHPNLRVQIVAEPPGRPSLPDSVDYYVATKRWGFDRGFAAAPIVHTVGRAGAVFTVIKGRG